MSKYRLVAEFELFEDAKTAAKLIVAADAALDMPDEGALTNHVTIRETGMDSPVLFVSRSGKDMVGYEYVKEGRKTAEPIEGMF